MRGFCLFLLFAAVAGCSHEASDPNGNAAQPAQMEQKTVAPSEKDLAHLADRELEVLRLIQSNHPDAKFAHDENDLQWLQRLVDEKSLRPDQSFDLQSLGVVLGQVFAAQTALKWIVVEDQYGRDLALQYPNTTVIVFPLTMISKRVEDGREIDIPALYRTVVEQVEQMKDDPDYKR